MKWRIEHTIDAPIARVEEALFDPAMTELVPRYMKLIEWAKPLSMTRSGNIASRVTHYRPNVNPPFAGEALTRTDTEFFEHFDYDFDKHSALLRVIPNIPAKYLSKFEGYGDYRLESRGPATTQRIFDGVIVFRAPLIGTLCEMFAISKLKVQFRHEADMLNAMVRGEAAISGSSSSPRDR